MFVNSDINFRGEAKQKDERVPCYLTPFKRNTDKSYYFLRHAFLEVDRTLCPILNSPFNDNSSSLIHVDISTSTTVDLSVSLLLEYVHDYQLR